LGRIGIAAVLVVGLLASTALPAHADGAGDVPPRPALKPLLLEPLVWDEACEPAHTRVELPVGRMSARMREAWGLPRTADPAHWSPGGLLLLGRAYETGEIGLPDPAEAARIYCLLLRHMGSRMGAFLLSRLHAKGAGVAFSPTLADHYARVAVRSWSAGEYRDVLTGPELAAGEFPADGIIDQQLAEAEAWLAAQEAAPLRARHRTVKRHLPGGAGLRSQMLVATLYRDLAYAASDKPETADITLAFVRHRLRVGPSIGELGLRDLERIGTLRALYRMAEYLNYAPAQSFLGDLYADGDVLPRSPVAAAIWYARARAGGADTGALIAAQLAKLPAPLRSAVARATDDAFTPWLIREPDEIKKLHRFLEEHFAHSE
jgi:hypothetical protein